jgi:hypothetical protein
MTWRTNDRTYGGTPERKKNKGPQRVEQLRNSLTSGSLSFTVGGKAAEAKKERDQRNGQEQQQKSWGIIWDLTSECERPNTSATSRRDGVQQGQDGGGGGGRRGRDGEVSAAPPSSRTISKRRGGMKLQ